MKRTIQDFHILWKTIVSYLRWTNDIKTNEWNEWVTVVSKRAKRACETYALLVLLVLHTWINSPYFFCSTGCSGTEGIRPVTNFVAFLAPYRDTFQGNKHPKRYYNNLIVFHNHYRYIVRRCWTLLRINSGVEKAADLESAAKLRNYANYSSFLYTPFLIPP